MPTRKILSLTLLAALAAAAAPAQTPPATETPEQILGRVETRLLAWDTSRARELFATLPNAGSPAAQVAAGRLLLQEGRLDEAATTLAAAAAAAPSDPEPTIHLAEAYRLAGRREEARQSFETAASRAAAGLQSAPDNVRLLVALGVAKQSLRQLPEATAALERARGLAPGNAEATYQLGVSRALQQQWAPAVDLLTEALQQNSEIAYAYYFRALAADKIGRKDLLINDLERFLALAPNAPEAPRARELLQALQG